MINNHNAEITPENLSSLETSTTLSHDLRRYITLLWQWAWLLILLTILAGGVAFFISTTQSPVYEASATMLIDEPRSASDVSNVLANERLALTYSKLMVQQPVMEGVINELGLILSADQLEENIQVDVVPDTQLLEVSVEDNDPVRAALIANTIGTVFVGQNEEFQASRYSETKENIAEQLTSTDLQIQETLKALGSLETQSESDLERSLLEAQLSVYMQIYQSLLQQSVQTEPSTSNNSTPGATTPRREVLSAQLDAVDQLIRETTQELNNLEGSGISEASSERNRLESNLTLYRQTYANLLQSFEQVRLAEIQNTPKVILVEPAVPPTKPIRPIILQDTLLAAVVGLILAGGIVFLIEALDDTIKGPEDIARHLNLPVLSIIAKIEEEHQEELIAATHPRSPITEAFRSMRTNIQYAHVDAPLQTIMVTSPAPQDGKSLIAANLGVVIAQSQLQVAVVDADLRRSSQHIIFRTPNRIGLSDSFIQASGYINGTLRKTAVENLVVLPSGPLPPNPSELIGSEKMTEILSQIMKEADMIIIDTPPLMLVTDAVALAPRVDGVILVVRVGITKLAAAKQAALQLRRSGAKVLGVVLNDPENNHTRYNYYYQGYPYNFDGYYMEPDNRGKNNKSKRVNRTLPQRSRR